ncbi:PREDICTED: uncharacterized protein LOC107352003 [Acropora digitifera]|uniref:uncharacterized protein LOC107352003 n=1 Tax=Acropora digitifera TaxID=70779 RepID=UPI00077A1F37|nr:PREDICTED: uncharacterized protein LOC107352003 [Acropora digitifera]
MRIFFSCKEAEKWNWPSYTPSGMDGAKFYTYLFMAEIASICSVLLWFIIVILSARNFKQDLLNIRLEEYYLNEERLHYMQQQPVQDDPRFEVRSERGSRYEVRSERGSRYEVRSERGSRFL